MRTASLVLNTRQSCKSGCLFLSNIIKFKMEEKLGEYIYMGMGKCKGETVCMSVAYKIDYCIKKAKKFEVLLNGAVKFYKVNKVKVGELEAQESFNTEGGKNE